ncbi:1,4-alpha-glucan branching protein GlgB [Colwellia sp. D2M02]|uniref:1,4-alpha-glucan branching protein GlgB n=1 Tax=Colwellia sp. D2M02 TaxID=2841562 RepID=UPI001C092823|nr:1,4-alpha-glucan branching protein GlgB [Colwellia sp. D2M02]MBU2893399.1 1,4-alpha-glucan branching protein GlgB [Colwellia sp. D2M02]
MLTKKTISQCQPVMNYDAQVNALEQAHFADPFSFLGVHYYNDEAFILRAYINGATAVSYKSVAGEVAYQRYQDSSLFILVIAKKDFKQDYQLVINYPLLTVEEKDSYAFSATLDESAMYLFNEGSLAHAYRHLGAHWREQEGTLGVRFTLWAPNAQSVSLIGDFNHWDTTRHFMRKHPSCGVWEIFISNVEVAQCYKFSLLTCEGDRLEKADPLAFSMQAPPATASIVPEKSFSQNLQQQNYTTNAVQAEARASRNSINKPISIYEVHAGSWQRNSDEVAVGNKGYLSYQQLAEKLVPYVQTMGFTHIQLMPISEYPFDGSWGYQPVGLFAPTSRFGGIEDFRHLVDACHQANIGLLVDWVPGHFPNDSYGLAKFDGTHLFEHADKRQGFHPDWQTHIYNYERGEVKSFLISNAMFWLDYFSIDGLRVDAVASMLYLDYSRAEGEWLANEFGGRENLAAIELLKQVNQRCYEQFPHIMMAAEESTAWPGVTKFTEHGGLGFGYKWNMGWMNDSLSYMTRDPLYRSHHHNEMTFSLMYAYSENYILPLSHDEVVHGKGSLLNKMPGDDWQKFANLRAYYAYMWAHPGKKLLFMGGEFAQRNEWNHDASLDWHLLDYAPHQGMQNLIKQLNHYYCQSPALYELDNDSAGFRWLDGNNYQQSIFSFIRFAKDANDYVVVLTNMTPNTQQCFRLGVPDKASYRIVFNSDDHHYGGSDFNQQTLISSENIAWQGFAQSISVELPPLATVYLVKGE